MKALCVALAAIAMISCSSSNEDEADDQHRPRIDSMSPTSGPPGTRITMTGEFTPWSCKEPCTSFNALLNAHAVQFSHDGEDFLAEPTFLVTSTELVVEVPDWATTGPIAVFFAQNVPERTALEHPTFEVQHPNSIHAPEPKAVALARVGATLAAQLDDSHVIAVGGVDFDRDTQSEDLYWDLDSGKFITASSNELPRVIARRAALTDGTVVVTGGLDTYAFDTNRCDMLDVAKVAADEAAQEWVSCPELAHGRYAHTMTTLEDGSVLAAGGGARGGMRGQAERWSLGQDAWAPAGELLTERYNHTATLLKDGRVLVAGGHPGGERPSLASAELFDPATETWSPTGSMQEGRGNHEALLLPDGRVVVVGGAPAQAQPHALGSVEVFDPESETWATWPSLNQPRFSHGLLHVQGLGLVVVGGISPPYTTDYRGLRSIEVLALDASGEPAGGWEHRAPLTSGANLPAVVPLHDSSVLVVSMDEAVRFGP